MKFSQGWDFYNNNVKKSFFLRFSAYRVISLCVVGHDRRSASLSTVRVANKRPIRSLTRKYEKEYKKTSIQTIFTPKNINPLFEELSKVNQASDLNVAYNCS